MARAVVGRCPRALQTAALGSVSCAAIFGKGLTSRHRQRRVGPPATACGLHHNPTCPRREERIRHANVRTSPRCSGNSSRGERRPHSGEFDGAAIADISVVWENSWQSTDLHYLTDDDRAQLIFELKDGSAPTAFDVAVDLPAGARLILNSDLGAVFVVDSHENVIGVFAQPWAVGADGLSVPTEFEIVGDTLRQHEGAAYPLVADPQYTWGWVTDLPYFSRQETKNAQTQAGAALIVGGLCAYFGPLTLGAACAISVAFYAQWAFQANRAFNDGRCLKIKIPTFEAGSYPFGERICTDRVSSHG